MRLSAFILLVLLALPAQFARSSSVPIAPKPCCEHMEPGKPCDGCTGAAASQHSKCCVDSAFQTFFSATAAFVPEGSLKVHAFVDPEFGRARNDPPLLTPPRTA